MPHDLSYQDERAVNTDSLAVIVLERNRYMLVIGIMADDYFVN